MKPMANQQTPSSVTIPLLFVWVLVLASSLSLVAAIEERDLQAIENKAESFLLKNITTSDRDNAGNAAKSSSLRKTAAVKSRALKAKTIDDMKQDFELAKGRLYTKLKEQYGDENFEPIFTPDNVSRGLDYLDSPTGRDGLSRQRLVRKLAVKILKVLVEGSDTEKFVWMAGGHSAAAGHGNLYSENYMAVLQENAKEVFAAVGLQLHAKNYAMGATPSGREIGSCLEAIFGLDMDILSWDYGMLDSSKFELLRYYCHRAARHVNRPACVVHVSFGRTAKQRVELCGEMEAAGMTCLYAVPSVHKAAVKAFPDSKALTLEEIEAMPTHVRSFRCGNKEEDGEPTCGAAKYTKTGEKACDNRRFRVSWHPGWKTHALMGNLKALSMTEFIHEALELIGKPGQDLAGLLKELQDQDEADYQKYMADPKFEDFFYKSPNVCHTARLPAETRFQGIVTESDKTGFFDYEKGQSMLLAKKLELENNAMPLVYDTAERQICSVPLQVDYKDTFITWGTYPGYTTLAVPNDAERKAYMAPGQELNGTIAICFKRCDWGRCPEGSVVHNNFNESKASFQVNGQDVLALEQFGDCSFLKGPQGKHGWPANENGQYVLGISLPVESAYAAISSVVVW